MIEADCAVPAPLVRKQSSPAFGTRGLHDLSARVEAAARPASVGFPPERDAQEFWRNKANQ